MQITRVITTMITLFLVVQAVPLQAQNENGLQFPQPATFTTLITTPRSIEGLTGDNNENLHTAGSGAPPCPIWQMNLRHPSLTVVGDIPAALTTACNLQGVALDAAGNLYVADQTVGTIYRVAPNAAAPPDATVFASGVPGTNGFAFDRDGNLWTGDGRLLTESGKSRVRAPTVPLQAWRTVQRCFEFSRCAMVKRSEASC